MTRTETISRARRFSQLPDALIDDKRVSHVGVRMWAKLDRYAGQDGRAFPSRARLAEDLGCSLQTVTRILSELVSTGWITRTRRPGGSWDTTLNERPIRRRRTATGGSRLLKNEQSDYSNMSSRRRASEGEPKPGVDLSSHLRPDPEIEPGAKSDDPYFDQPTEQPPAEAAQTFRALALAAPADALAPDLCDHGIVRTRLGDGTPACDQGCAP